MKNIKICIGSSCHLKGSDEVIKKFQELINEFKLEDNIELYGSFCLDRCTNGVSVMRWDGEILSVSRDNVREIFEKEIIPYI
ncbi:MULTISPECIES: (2Fe-2S) ferredoxin domain-containing protein [unclassified Romboutsia]|uniref:(2Fe-2S) ferredoxin domain-containing protein n=1 Tax=unclassified Romboutsia TaxID=2626894 RepID=UPI000820EB1A|nr:MULTISPECIES: (2Fe-2S) ferredoxin domain-containing protein [unclassified Romboutsia]SCH75167.1 NADH:ubiquinone oxidoreductase 24 kD subunit [uncultured Clostridium sp.]